MMKEKILEILHGPGERIAAIIIFTIIIAFAGYVYWVEENYEYRCVGESKVVEILSLRYRSADILLENGMVITVNQATLTVGDNYCYEYKEFEIEDE